MAAFGELKLQELTLGRTPLDGAEETYAVLSRIPTLTKLNLSFSEIEALPEGEPRSPNASARSGTVLFTDSAMVWQVQESSAT